MGMNHPGEISSYCKIVKPHISIITNISEAHIGLLKNKASIMDEKADIIRCLDKKDIAILNTDDSTTAALKKETPAKVITFGTKKNASIKAENLEIHNNFSIFSISNKKIKLNLPGLHNICNALAASAAALAIGCSASQIKKGLESFKAQPLRSEIINTKIQGKKATIIKDCYNANPTSIRIALDLLSNFKGRKIAILGDMKELGKFSKTYHEDLGEHIYKNKCADILLTFGKEAKRIAVSSKMKNSFSFFDIKSLTEKLSSVIEKNDVILIKGSRAMQMEQILENLK